MATRHFTRPAGRIDFVRNRSDRRGSDVDLIVIHTTESHERPGRGDVDSIHAWFDNPASQASSHVIIDAEGHSTTCVPDAEKAWTCAAYNSRSLNIELIGWATTSRWQWLKQDRQLRKTAQFVAYWSAAHGIPLTRVANAVQSGVCGHMDLGLQGGGHHDPGEGFPFDRLIRYAKYYKKNGWTA
jgi:N-acetyl-anhydromuramyl-L-alanine amidase AmpD